MSLAPTMVEHHTHYKEIHGYDKTVWITKSEHRRLHIRLRKEKKCNVPVDELHKISTAAYHRTDKAKLDRKQNIPVFAFDETLMPNIRLHEQIHYNKHTGEVYVNTYFHPNNGKKIWYHDCGDASCP